MRKIIPASFEDLPKVLELFRESISKSGVGHYTPSQLMAWSSSADDVPRWQQKIKDDYFILAMERSTLLGFASLKGPDYLDVMYVAPEAQRLGVASSLLAAIEEEARSREIHLIHSDVSRMARSFFEQKGFYVVKAQQVVRKGEWLENFRMEKALE